MKHVMWHLVLTHAAVCVGIGSFFVGCGGAAAPIPLAPVNANAEPGLLVGVDGFKRPEGTLRLAVFTSEKGFPEQENAVYTEQVDVHSQSMQLSLPSLPSGPLAVVVFHDVNKNGKLDTNLLGIPKEPFGFSRNPVVRFGPPDFNQCAVRAQAEEASTLTINLNSM